MQRQAPDYVRAVLAEYSQAQLLTLKGFSPVSGPEPAVFSVVRNELDRLPEFLRHYRAAGIDRFVIIDNGSTDGTAEFLCDQPDCHVLSITAPFDWRRKHGWIMLAIGQMGRGRDVWYLYADADEHIVFDGLGQLTFGDLCRICDARGLRRVRGMLVDMYAAGPLLGSTYQAGDPLLASYPWFDAGGYDERRFPEVISRKGGPRQRAFGAADPTFRPEMTKYPLFKLRGPEVFANPHHVWPYADNFTSPCHLGLLHFKFLPDTLARIEAAVQAETYWGGSIEYKCYRKILSQTPDLSLVAAISRRYAGPESLVEAGLIARL